jgi:hypothetical protein
MMSVLLPSFKVFSDFFDKKSLKLVNVLLPHKYRSFIVIFGRKKFARSPRTVCCDCEKLARI